MASLLESIKRKSQIVVTQINAIIAAINDKLDMKTGGTIEGNITVKGDITGNLKGNATTADKLKNATSISLTGDVSGSASFDGENSTSISVTVADYSHKHTIKNIDNLETILDNKANSNSPEFKGTPTAPTASSENSSTQIATTEFVQAVVDSKIAAADAMIYKGTIGTNGTVTTLPNTHKTGWTYKVITAGTYAGMKCNIGDMIICLTDGTSANNAHWTVIEGNIDGTVTGPASSVSGQIAVFDGATGKVIKDSGFTIASSVPANAKFTDTTYTVGTANYSGTTKLYTSTGTAEDGAMTQKTVSEAIEAAKTAVEDGTVVAKKAKQDAAGNVITTTYATKSELSELEESLADVATSGEYKDLVGTPTSLRNPKYLTLQNSAGTNIGSYDGSTATTVKLTSATVGLGNVTNESKATMFTSPSFTGTPTAPTAKAGISTTQIATTAFVTHAVSDVVHTTGNETIDGVKTFSSNMKIQNTAPHLHLIQTDADRSKTPEERQFVVIEALDRYNKFMGHFANQQNTDGTITTYISVYDKNDQQAILGVHIKNDGTPYAYAPLTPAGSTGKEIVTANFLNDALSGVVHTAGNEKISDTKTFENVIVTDTLTIPGGSIWIE